MSVPNQTNNLLGASPNLLGGPPMTPDGGNSTGEFAEPPTATSQLPFISPTQPAYKQIQSPPETNENDLLGDLADFGSISLQPAKPAGNGNSINLNDGLMGGLLDNFSDGWTTKVDRKITPQKSLEESTVATIDKIRKIGRISSQQDTEKILQYVDDLLKNYPKKLNLRKLQGLEEGSYKYLAEHSFYTLVEVIVDLFDHNFPFRDGKIYESIGNIFSIEDPNFFESILEVLVKNLKNKKNIQSTNVAGCLQVLFESDALFANIIANCYLTKNITQSDDIISTNTDNWSLMVNTIIYLPTRVANKLERNAPIFLSNEQFSNMLFYNVVKAIEFLASEIYADSKAQNNIDFDKLAIFLSKIIIHFNENTNCDGVINFVNILALITNKPSQKLGLYQGIIHEVFEILDRTAVEILVKVCLTRVDPKQYLITNILNKKLVKNPNWQHILCTKLPFTEFIESNHENYVTNLILYLGKASHTELVKFLTNLVSVWANKSSTKRTSVEHQLLICKFIVCAVNCLKEIGLTDYEKSKINKTVHDGIQMHLEIALEAIRNAGMKTGEILTKFLCGENEIENQLVFDYKSISAETTAIITQLDYFLNLDLQELYKRKYDFSEINIEMFISKLRNKSEDVQYIPPERKFRSKHQKELHNELVITEYVKPKDGITIIDETLELDSDDEFEPYEIGNEVKLLSKQPPAYLRDLVTILIEEKNDVDSLTLCLENCEKLVIQQLPEDDASIGLEILSILLVLDNDLYVKNFEKLVFESCVAITCVYPTFYADYLCKEFHAEVGKCSVSHRVLILDIIRQASITLSSLTKTINEDADKIKLNDKKGVNLPQEMIKKRLESKTRYFHKHKVIKYEQRNKFADVAGYFFFPLMYGYNQNKLLSGDDSVLLIYLIETLACIMFCAKNCPIVPKMAKEALHFSWFLRYHKDVKVRILILDLIGAALTTVPKSILLNDFMNELFELRLWIADPAKEEPNTECRNLASWTLVFIEKLLKVDLE